MFKIELPPGIYYVGDPCYRSSTYVFETYDREWYDFEQGTKAPFVPSTSSSPSTFLVYHGTMCGDWTYECIVSRNAYPVDSGCLSVVKLESFDPDVDYGSVLTIESPWIFKVDSSYCFSGTTLDGEVLFSIPTGFIPGEEEDEDEGAVYLEEWRERSPDDYSFLEAS